MTYPCGMIKDLMPLYIDGVCGVESKNAVKEHLSECDSCRKYYEQMKETNGYDDGGNHDSEDKNMADSLKKVKAKINRKIRNIVIGAVSVTLVFTVGFQVLFNVPIQSVDKDKVKVTAEVYPFSELPHSITSDDDSVEVSFGEEDNSDVYRVEIPGTGDADVSVSENVMKREEFVTVITTSSDYFLKNIIWEIKDDTIYISSFRTTLLNNKAKSYQKTMTTIEFQEINKIVYQDGKTEAVLWKR